jgi:MGT family glycosyltransferase
MSTLALALQGRGHQVTFFCFADSEAFLRDAGLNCVVICPVEFPPGYVKEVFDKLGKLKGGRGLRYTLEILRKESVQQLGALPDALVRAGVQLLVIDQLFTAGSTVGDHLGLPYLHVANAILVNVNHQLPPVTLPWGNEANGWALARNRMAHLMIDRLLSPICKAINAQRREWNLVPYRRILNERFNPRPQICQQPPSFEFPRQDLPLDFHFVGPLHAERLRAAVPFAWDKLDGRPLIYASMGTLQNGLEWVFHAILAACAGLDAQLVLSLGGNMDPDRFPHENSGAMVVKFAPQVELLKQAALCITHAGLNTVLESLAQGVPMVAIPVTNDQPAVAARVKWTGTGEVLPLKRLKSDTLRARIIQVMSTSSYRVNAQKLQAEIAGRHSLDTACNIVERCLGQDRKTASNAV